MSAKSLWLAVAMLSAQGAMAQVTEPVQLAPSSSWLVDYQPNGCKMMRKFGNGDQQMALVMEAFVLNRPPKITVAGPAFAHQRPTQTIKFRFGPDGAWHQTRYFFGVLGGEMPAVTTLYGQYLAPDPNEVEDGKGKRRKAAPLDYLADSPQQRGAVRFMEVSTPLAHPVKLQTGAMDKPILALNKCLEHLMTSWGVDVEKYKKLSRFVTLDPKAKPLLDGADYPQKLAIEGKSARIHFLANVNAQGRATTCKILDATIERKFDDIVCNAIMFRGRFVPALDENGVPVDSVFVTSATFASPE